MSADLLLILARLLLGGAFFVFGIRNLPAVDKLAGVIAGWKLPLPKICAMIGVGLQLVGGLLVAVGILPWLGAAMLILFLILATVLFHPVWRYAGAERGPHVQALIMNIGLIGAFLLVIAVSL